MSFSVRSLALQKQQETHHNEEEWTLALETAYQSLKDSVNLERIAQASRSPADFTVIVRLIYQYGKSHPRGQQISEILNDFVNKSPFSLRDWVDAINYFYSWLQKNNRKTDLLKMLKYLQCCVASTEGQEARNTFVSVVQDMLDIHGYKG